MTLKPTKKIEHKIMEKLADKIEKETAIEVLDWPPVCTFYLHQPKRPELKTKQN